MAPLDMTLFEYCTVVGIFLLLALPKIHAMLKELGVGLISIMYEPRDE